ncbi:hypothetical protein QNI16_28655 [Cytophagaceae bacterium YF14B1]|uniref:Uncharacterized protein n=1 Tax=Xanthocytophaga flava TaxID=3048013 RepID=A0AAE3UBK7_9BACT|nr:hypothetical protein [Xanthocytophaga flavus]MDJ1484503.1 hypothetical protein [Xanthocytophaga flavus]
MNRILLTISVTYIFFILTNLNVFGQGCVAVRHMSCSAPAMSSSDLFKQNQYSKWQVSVGYRYLHSFRHFKGTEEQKERIANGTEVINDSHSFDIGLNYQFTNRLSFAVNLPVIINDRSSLYEHYGNSVTDNPSQSRFHTKSNGIGDMRLSVNYWVLNPDKHTKNNILFGVGVKLPTGNSNVKGDFHKLTKAGQDSIVNRAVDQSIQLGDGGVALNLEVQGYSQLASKTTLYYNGFYMFNFRETNKTLNRGTLTGVDPIIAYHSVADQYAARMGINQAFSFLEGFSVMLGGRVEGVPAHDVIGGSKGFRRPGYIVSGEPGIAYMNSKYSLTCTVPVALARNRIKSYYDLQDPTGKRHGDAAFADYFISVNVTRRF